MGFDVIEGIAWVEQNVFIPCWNWANFDCGGFHLYDYALLIALAGFCSIWVVKRFKNVFHQRYDDHFEIGEAKVEARLHEMAGRIENKVNLPFFTGFGQTFEGGISKGPSEHQEFYDSIPDDVYGHLFEEQLDDEQLFADRAFRYMDSKRSGKRGNW